MKPWQHSQVSARKFGGKPEDYQEIHDFIDSPKSCFADMRHRSILHHSLGCFIVEQMFGDRKWTFKGKFYNPFSWNNWAYIKMPYITNSNGRKVSVRDIAEQHMIDDLGKIPTVQDYLQEMPMYHWLGGPKRKVRTILMDEKQVVTADGIQHLVD